MIVLCGWLSDVQRKGARRWKRKNYVHFIQHIRRPRPRPTAHCNVEATLAFPLRSTSESTHYRVNYLGKTSDMGRARRQKTAKEQWLCTYHIRASWIEAESRRGCNRLRLWGRLSTNLSSSLWSANDNPEPPIKRLYRRGIQLCLTSSWVEPRTHLFRR